MSKRTFSDSGLEADEDDCGYGYEDDNRLGIPTPFYRSTPADREYGYGNLHAGWDAYGFTFRHRGSGIDWSRAVENTGSPNMGSDYDGVDTGNTAPMHQRAAMSAAQGTFDESADPHNAPRYTDEVTGHASDDNYPTPVDATHHHHYHHYYHDHDPVVADNLHHHPYHNHTPASPADPPTRSSSATSNLSSNTLINDQPMWHTATTHFLTPPLSAATLALPERSNTAAGPFPPVRRFLADVDALAIPAPASIQEQQPQPALHAPLYEPLAFPEDRPAGTIDREQREPPWSPRHEAWDAQQEVRAEHESMAERLRQLVNGSMWRRGWGWGEGGRWESGRALADAEDDGRRDDQLQGVDMHSSDHQFEASSGASGYGQGRGEGH